MEEYIIRYVKCEDSCFATNLETYRPSFMPTRALPWLVYGTSFASMVGMPGLPVWRLSGRVRPAYADGAKPGMRKVIAFLLRRTLLAASQRISIFGCCA